MWCQKYTTYLNIFLFTCDSPDLCFTVMTTSVNFRFTLRALHSIERHTLFDMSARVYGCELFQA